MTNDNTPTFALLGCGYAGRKHAQAIKAVGGELVAACDPYSSVGWLDEFFPECEFYREPERLLCDIPIVTEWLVIATPSYLHASHMYLGDRSFDGLICEKPLVADESQWPPPYEEAGIYPVLQLRHLPCLKDLHPRNYKDKADVKIDYVAPRGPWYFESWKVDRKRSGGVVLNLGIHLLDLCIHLFGPCVQIRRARVYDHTASGVFECERAVVDFRLSCLERVAKRVMRVDGVELNLTPGLDLHAEVYRAALRGEGVPLSEVEQGLRLAWQIDELGRDAVRRGRP